MLNVTPFYLTEHLIRTLGTCPPVIQTVQTILLSCESVLIDATSLSQNRNIMMEKKHFSVGRLTERLLGDPIRSFAV